MKSEILDLIINAQKEENHVEIVNDGRNVILFSLKDYWLGVKRDSYNDRSFYKDNVLETLRAITEMLVPGNNHLQAVSGLGDGKCVVQLPDLVNGQNKGELCDYIISRIDNNNDYKSVPDLMISLISYALTLDKKMAQNNQLKHDNLVSLFATQDEFNCFDGFKSVVINHLNSLSKKNLIQRIHEQCVNNIIADVIDKGYLRVGDQVHLLGAVSNLLGVDRNLVLKMDNIFQVAVDNMFLKDIWPLVRDYDILVGQVFEKNIGDILQFYESAKRDISDVFQDYERVNDIVDYINGNLDLEITAHDIVAHDQLILTDDLEKLIYDRVVIKYPFFARNDGRKYYRDFIGHDLDVTKHSAIGMIANLIAGNGVDEGDRSKAREVGLFALATIGKKFKHQNIAQFLAILDRLNYEVAYQENDSSYVRSLIDSINSDLTQYLARYGGRDSRLLKLHIKIAAHDNLELEDFFGIDIRSNEPIRTELLATFCLNEQMYRYDLGCS